MWCQIPRHLQVTLEPRKLSSRNVSYLGSQSAKNVSVEITQTVVYLEHLEPYGYVRTMVFLFTLQ